LIESKTENVPRETMRREIASTLNHSDEVWNASDSSNENLRGALREARAARERMLSHLQITKRAGNRLPPLYTNRAGWLGRLELWFKQAFGRATRWYAWEQINFNAATMKALSEALHMLSLYETLIEELQSKLQELHSERSSTESRLLEIDSRFRRIEQDLQLIADHQRSTSAPESLAANASDATRDDALRESINELRAEQRARVEQLLDDQRTIFKQFVLQIAEQTTATERVKRFTESRLDELAKQIEELRRFTSKP
jgi:hypothetical protein